MTSFFFISLSNQVEGERKGGGVGLRGRGRDRGLRLCQELRGERGVTMAELECQKCEDWHISS